MAKKTVKPKIDANECPKKAKPRKKKNSKKETTVNIDDLFPIEYTVYNNAGNYIQIGCDFYMIGWRPDARNHLQMELKPWKYSQIKRDFAMIPNEINNIPRYVGVCCLPDNTSQYRQNVGDYYNTYSRLCWIPTPGSFETIKKLISHIFGDQYELGLDYIQLLYLAPKQILPILVLVSAERNTGKTTFLDFLKEIFADNMVFVTNETMRSNFNSERAGKLIVACDEAFLNKKEDSEKLKNISTAKKTYLEPKGKDRYEVDNYAKFILCSNNLVDPIYIDYQEVRYWVRQVPVLTYDDPFFLEAMKKEIPAFLYFLTTRQLSVPTPLSRMWFAPTSLRTDAMLNIMKACRPSDELELAEFLLEVMDDFGVNKLEYTTRDLNELLKCERIDINGAHRIISKQWAVPHATSKMAYDLYAKYVDSVNRRKYGRFYTFTREFLSSIVPQSSGTAVTPPTSSSVITVGKLF